MYVVGWTICERIFMYVDGVWVYETGYLELLGYGCH